MQFREDCKTSAELLRRAIPLMVEREIPSTPNNYALWYAHVTEDYPELSDCLLEYFPAPGSYDAAKSDALFFEHFIKHKLPETSEAQASVAALLAQLFGVVNKTADGTQEYGDSLQKAMATLQSSSDQEEIHATLSQVLEQTQVAENLNREFQSELSQARQEVEALKEALEASRKDALIDELTQIDNRRAFDQTIEQSLRNSPDATVLLLLDLDHFKRCNDTYGHVMGDKVLECMGQLLARARNDKVHVARYGGEEFAVIVNDSLDAAVALAEHIRTKVSNIRITQAGGANTLDTLSVSVGVARAKPGENARSLKERADAALYQAKGDGRNCVCIFNETVVCAAAAADIKSHDTSYR